MSYARWSETSNVYVFLSDSGLECCRCSLQERGPFIAHSTVEMVIHLATHRRAGHLVEHETVDWLLEDADENDADMGAS